MSGTPTMTGIFCRPWAAVWIVSVAAILLDSGRSQAAPPQHVAVKQSALPRTPTAQVSSPHVTSRQRANEVQLASGGLPYHDGITAGCAHGGCDQVTMGAASPAPISGWAPIWGNFEYLLWWTDDASLPALVTTSPNGTARDNAAVLGLETTSVLFGGRGDTDNDSQSGARITLGMWLNSGQTQGVFGRWFTLDGSELGFQRRSNGSDILGRPFFNVLTNEQDALLLGFPNEITGDIDATYASDASGFEVLLRQLCRAECNYRIDFVYGYRHLTVDERLRIDNFLEFIDPASNSFGNTIDQRDLFEIENEFNGGEFGFMGHSVDGRFTMDILATVSLGSLSQRTAISGSTVTTPQNGDPFTADGGLLTQTSNIGTFEDDKFTVIPEFTVNLGYLVTPRMDMSVGYTFMYVDNVARVGDSIDTNVNLSQQTGVVDGPERPEFRSGDGGFWLQGLNFGLNLRY